MHQQLLEVHQQLTGTNVQSVAVQSTPNYSNLYSANSLTQGANRGQVTDVQNSSETARAMADTSVADPTKYWELIHQ